ncbi:MAG: Dam family site-specific DNA-(adenine-N6)-methyltransferase, partial [Bacilli bacterium]
MRYNDYVKSPLNYTGGKYKLLNNIITTFPSEIKNFVDLFAGGLNVGINVDAKNIYVNDHITYLIELYEYFTNTPIDRLLSEINNEIAKYSLSDTNADGYLKLRKEYNNNKNILHLFILTCYSFNHQIRFNNKHEFNTPFGKARSSFNSSIENNLIAFTKALQTKNIIFSNEDFLSFDFDILKSEDLVYCDPPYLISNGSYNDGKRGFKDWTEQEEFQLLNLLDEINDQNIKFALSNVFYHKGASNKMLLEWSKKYQ